MHSLHLEGLHGLLPQCYETQRFHPDREWSALILYHLESHHRLNLQTTNTKLQIAAAPVLPMGHSALAHAHSLPMMVALYVTPFILDTGTHQQHCNTS